MRSEQNQNNPGNKLDLMKDPDYLRLMDHFQHAEFEKCENFVNELKRRYPNHPEVKRIEDNLQVKLTLRDMQAKNIREDKRKKAKSTAKLGVFAIVSFIVVLVALILSLIIFSGQLAEESLVQRTVQVDSLRKLYNQAESLLVIGNPQAAGEIVQRINEIDPSFEGLADLAARTNALLTLKSKYDAAENYFAQKQYVDALPIYKEIEAQAPGMWNVRQRIEQIESDNGM
jgi:tetratricopeptide (TPR) repeat protein